MIKKPLKKNKNINLIQKMRFIIGINRETTTLNSEKLVLGKLIASIIEIL